MLTNYQLISNWISFKIDNRSVDRFTSNDDKIPMMCLAVTCLNTRYFLLCALLLNKQVFEFALRLAKDELDSCLDAQVPSIDTGLGSVSLSEHIQ